MLTGVHCRLRESSESTRRREDAVETQSGKCATHCPSLRRRAEEERKSAGHHGRSRATLTFANAYLYLLLTYRITDYRIWFILCKNRNWTHFVLVYVHVLRVRRWVGCIDVL